MTGVPAYPDMCRRLLGWVEIHLWGLAFGVVALQAMVGTLVGEVLGLGAGVGVLVASSAPPISLDTFSLLAVGNVLLGHVLGLGLNLWQLKVLLRCRGGENNVA